MDGVANLASQQAWRVARALSGRILAQSESGGNANSVWSPACVANLLAVAREGSAGATRWELDALLGDGDLLVEPDPFDVERKPAWGYDGYEASSATAAWLSKLATPSDAFLRKCDECGVHVSVDDLGDPRVSREVSAWISEKTRGLLSPAISLSSVALACLVSALYLKNAWADPFEEYLTNRALFHAEDGGVRVAFMHDERCCRVIDGDDCVAFGMPLSSDAEMLFTLPNSGGDHMGEALELFERLSCGEGERELVELGIPRFECETTIPDLGMQLEAAGVYSASAMNLVPMVGVEPTPTQVIHGAKLSIDEKGVEAGAYTIMIACAGCPPENPPEPRKITLNRPFYVAVASRTGAPLFVGHVALP